MSGPGNDLELDGLLAESGPRPLSDDPAVMARLAELVSDARPAAAPRANFWRRKRVLIPAATALALALTGAGVGVWWAQNPDVVIPISYVTDTGKTVSCTFALTAGPGHHAPDTPPDASDNEAALREFFARHDWTGLGQQAYDRIRSGTPVSGPAIQGTSQRERDLLTLNRTVTDLVSEQIPPELGSGASWGAGSDCTGELR